MSEAVEAPPVEGAAPQQHEKTFTQAEVDQLITARAERMYKQRLGDVDIDALKSQVEAARTAATEAAELRDENAKLKREGLVVRIAAKFGVSTEPAADGGPSDADLFLTASDEDALAAQAQRFVGRDADRRRQGNYVPNEGKTNPPKADSEMREFARNLFGSKE